MPKTLPPLRRVLDILPSPDAARPGLLLRDPYRYTDTLLFVPRAWAWALRYLDGKHTELDLQEVLTRATGQLVFSSDIEKFVGVLQENGFLETEEFEQLRQQRESEFREAPRREAIHAGTAYPETAPELRRAMENHFRAGAAASDGLSRETIGLAAPHVSPEGGRNCYAAAYAGLTALPGLAERTFVVLGTSHYGPPEQFGLTRKPFVTPLGTLQVDTGLVDWLERRAGDSVRPEDYCHCVEHSIEFQCLFLQHALGPELKIVPILCGPFAQSLATGRTPETNEGVARFCDALGEMAEWQGRRLFWVLGIDLAHIGRRYGDPLDAVAGRGPMTLVAEQDRRRLELACAGDEEGFFDLVKPKGDELKWCGYSPLYTFLKSLPRTRGRLLRYEQWNIDPQSVVTFAGLHFTV